MIALAYFKLRFATPSDLVSAQTLSTAREKFSHWTDTARRSKHSECKRWRLENGSFIQG